MEQADYFQKRAREHHTNLLKLLEMQEAGVPHETLKAFVRIIKQEIISDRKLDASNLPSKEWQAHRAIHQASCHLGSVLTHNPSSQKWGHDVLTAESDLSAWLHRSQRT